MPTTTTTTLMALALLVTMANGQTTTLTLQVDRDNTLCEGSALANGASDNLFLGTSGSGMRHRPLFYINLSTALPPGRNYTVKTAAFQAYVARAGTEDTTDVAMYEVTQAWGEGTSSATGGECAAATPQDATWNYTFFAAKTRWRTPGGDIVSQPLAMEPVAAQGQTYVWASAALAQAVQRWVDSPTTNMGFLLKVANESVDYSAKRLVSREGTDPTQLPVLVITYATVAPTTAEPATTPEKKASGSGPKRGVVVAVTVSLAVVAVAAIAAVFYLRQRRVGYGQM